MSGFDEIIAELEKQHKEAVNKAQEKIGRLKELRSNREGIATTKNLSTSSVNVKIYGIYEQPDSKVNEIYMKHAVELEKEHDGYCRYRF